MLLCVNDSFPIIYMYVYIYIRANPLLGLPHPNAQKRFRSHGLDQGGRTPKTEISNSSSYVEASLSVACGGDTFLLVMNPPV